MFYTPARRQAYVPELRSFDRVLERMLSNAVTDTAPTIAARTAHSAQVSQDGIFTLVTLDTPGLSREQITIEIDGNVVRLENVKDAPRQLKVAYELAQDIDVDASEARLENGVLTLKLARKEVVPTARNLMIS
jgi:HSP20 family protein